MRTTKILTTLLIGFVISIAYATNLQAIQFDSGAIKVTQLTLKNGLTVILNEDNSKPEVFGVVIVKAGSKDDPSDATGLAHYMEHMLFKGTQSLGTIDWEKEKPHIDRIFQLYDDLSKAATEEERKKIQQEINEESLKASEYAIPNEMSNLINGMGGTNLNAGTGPDWTIFYNKFPSTQIFKWIDLYAHRFINPVFRSFQAELEVVYEEKNMRGDQFQRKLLEDFQLKLFKNHPYGQQPSLGTIEHLKNPSLKRMLEFYDAYYVANNMALVISGDFSSEEIIPFIEEKFGAIPSGAVPEKKVYNEDPFNGREFYEARLTPIKLGMLGFRTVTSEHPDFIPLEVALQVLNNRNQTGLLDKKMIDGDVLAAQGVNLPYHDHGAVMFFVVPKIVGQKTEAAEKIVLNELARLGRGDFEDWILDAIKLREYINFNTDLENLENRALLFAQAFAKGEKIEDALDRPKKIIAVTKDDVMRVTQTYFGNNYLAFHSKMGFPKKEKIEKPGFKPLIANTNAKSQYALHYETVPSKESVFTPIDFDNDISHRTISKGVDIYHVNNPVNNIFSLTLQYQVGNHHIKLLDKATSMMDFAGTTTKSVDELKKEFAKIGSSYSIYSDDSYTYVKLEGVDENLTETLTLINELLTSPVLKQEKLKTLIDGEKAGRKFERSEPDNVASALFDYIRFEKQSKNINRLTMSEVKKLKATELTDSFIEATNHSVQIHYVGCSSPESLYEMVSTNIKFASEPKVVDTPVVLQAQNFNENTIFFVNKKKARQSKIFFFANGEPYNTQNEPQIEAFNEYFGGGFSGLVLQEIREYRSLAYGAGGNFRLPPVDLKPLDFIGYVATQADKSLIAISTYDSLIRSMPQKPERIDLVKDYLILSSQTRRPDFRNLSQTVMRWKRMGYSVDPMIHKLPAYKELTWENLMDFYTNHLAQKPVAIAIVGDKAMIDLNALKRYGKIVEIKEKDLFSK
jgi:predicted Zn-dependent peptidase